MILPHQPVRSLVNGITRKTCSTRNPIGKWAETMWFWHGWNGGNKARQIFAFRDASAVTLSAQAPRQGGATVRRSASLSKLVPAKFPSCAIQEQSEQST
jgi:hypothetical protein